MHTYIQLKMLKLLPDVEDEPETSKAPLKASDNQTQIRTGKTRQGQYKKPDEEDAPNSDADDDGQVLGEGSRSLSQSQMDESLDIEEGGGGLPGKKK
jgi:hypothetical protein